MYRVCLQDLKRSRHGISQQPHPHRPGRARPRAYIAEPDRGRDLPEAQARVYANRRRLRRARGGRIRRHRAEYVERSLAHLYETGAMRRTHLRGHQNILKRLLVHAGAFNLGLLMRQLVGHGTPRGLWGSLRAVLRLLMTRAGL